MTPATLPLLNECVAAGEPRWETLLAIDFDKSACATYRANFPGVRVECGPVADYLDSLPDADVILGGPPCQPHSHAGKRLASADERDGGDDYIAAIHRVRPRMFLMENVPGLLTSEGGRYFQRLWAALEEPGYVLQYRVLDAVDFGVPQFRSRLWVWGIRADLYRDGIRHAWPVPTHRWPPPCGEGLFGASLLPGVTVGQALGIPAGIIFRKRSVNMGERPPFSVNEPSMTVMGGDGRGGSTGAMYLEQDVIEYRWSDEYRAKHPPISPNEPSQTVVGQWHKGAPNGCLLMGTHHDIHPFLELDEPALTQRNKIGSQSYVRLSGDKVQGGKVYVRRLLPLECARLQSVHDGFAWPEKITKTAMYKVIGNGWASGMAWRISQALAVADPDSRTVADLFCGGGLGASGWAGRYWSYVPTLAPEQARGPGGGAEGGGR